MLALWPADDVGAIFVVIVVVVSWQNFDSLIKYGGKQLCTRNDVKRFHEDSEMTC